MPPMPLAIHIELPLHLQHLAFASSIFAIHLAAPRGSLAWAHTSITTVSAEQTAAHLAHHLVH